MANQWDSEYAIWRDLYVAQGREVPAQIDRTVAMNERPPRVALVEETEEQFFGNYVDGGDYSSGPDLSLITKMLQEAQTSQNDRPEENVRERKQKNAAMESILKMYNNKNEQSFKNGSLKSSTLEQNILTPCDMFKKKTKRLDNSSDSTGLFNQSVPASVVEQPRMFVPSSRAAEYYRRYLEQSQAQERAREDVWARAQREMRELDKKKVQATSQCGSSSSDALAHGVEAVLLATPRHSFTDTKDCVVCQVLCTHTAQTETHNGPK